MNASKERRDGPNEGDERRGIRTRSVIAARWIILFLLIMAALGAAVIVGRFSFSGPRTNHDWPPEKRLIPVDPVRPFVYQGVASCAAAACHHAIGSPGERRSEYTTWVAHDGHARAYVRLLEEPAREMTRRYRGKAHARPENDPLCLSCHVLPNYETVKRDGVLSERFAKQDGVGCEVCHGPAEKWLTVHHLDGWKAKTAVAKARQGMTDMKNLRVRAEVCVRCHVGGGDADVNHDLIASGHPRLLFEAGAHLARYPRHWKLSDDKKRHPDFEARVWLVGRLVSAKAALELLSERAKGNGRPWPEFAEYNCADCHHRLQDSGHRRQSGHLDGRPAGSPRWGTWHYPLLPTLARHAKGGTRFDLTSLTTLRQDLMRRLIPDGRMVREEAECASAAVGAWLEETERTPLTAKELICLLDVMSKETGAVRSSWEEAAEVYLSVAALHQGLIDLVPAYQAAKTKKAIRTLKVRLEASFRSERRTRYATPDEFDPEQLAKDLRALERELQGAAKRLR